jgi:hypothetical protein
VYYVGRGNNGALVQSLMKNRYWWVEGPIDQANFVWTQNKKQNIFQTQSSFVICEEDAKKAGLSDSNKKQTNKTVKPISKTKIPRIQTEDGRILSQIELSQY